MEARECNIPSRRLGFPSGRRIEDNGNFSWGQAGQRPDRWDGTGIKHTFEAPGRGCLGDHVLHLHQLNAAGRADAYQIIDLGPFARPDTSFVGARALFDREDTALSGPNPALVFELKLSAFDGLPTSYVHGITTPVSTTTARLISDDNRDTWEELTTSLRMPPGTRYLVVAVGITGTVDNSVSTHYVDGVRVAMLDRLPRPPYDLRLERFLIDRHVFSILVHNDGPNDAEAPRIKIDVPPGFNPRSDGSVTAGTFNLARHEWNPGDLPSGAFRQLWLNGTTSTGTFTGTIISALEGDLDASNNRLSASAGDPTRTYDLAIGEGGGVFANPTWYPDRIFGAQVWVANTGPDDALGVEVTIPPDGYTVLPNTIHTEHGSFEPTTGIWSVGTIPSGDVAQLFFSARTTYSPGSHNFAASITNGLGGDTSSSNNTVLAPFTIRNTSYDIQANQPIPSTSFPSVGESFFVQFTFTNLGPDLVRRVEAMIPVPEGVTLVSAPTASGITYDPATGLLTIGGLGPGQRKGVTPTFTSTTPGLITLRSGVTYAPADTDASNNQISLDIDIRQ